MEYLTEDEVMQMQIAELKDKVDKLYEQSTYDEKLDTVIKELSEGKSTIHVSFDELLNWLIELKRRRERRP